MYLDLHVSVDNRRYAREKIVEFARFAGIDRPVDELQIVAGEALQNILRHAYKPRDAGRVSIEVHRSGTTRYLHIRDYGTGFNTRDVNIHDADRIIDDPISVSEDGKMGLILIALAVGPDNVFLYSDRDEGTQLVLRFPEEEIAPESVVSVEACVDVLIATQESRLWSWGSEAQGNHRGEWSPPIELKSDYFPI